MAILQRKDAQKFHAQQRYRKIVKLGHIEGNFFVHYLFFDPPRALTLQLLIVAE